MGAGEDVAALAGSDWSWDCAFGGTPENSAMAQTPINGRVRKVQKIWARINLKRFMWTPILFRVQKASQIKRKLASMQS
jgi:hypothetical protein